MIGRRGAIGGLMTWWAAGNARTPQGPQSREGNRPDRKPLGVTRAGVGPAPQQGTFIGRLVVVGGTGIVGFFEYNGSPGAGNPPVAYSAPPGVTKDPYGNVLPQTGGGFTSVNSPLWAALTGVVLEFGGTGVTSSPIVGSGSDAHLLMSSGQTAALPNSASLDLTSVATGAEGIAILSAAMELAEVGSLTVAAVSGGPQIYGNSSGHAEVVSDTNHGDGNSYDVERLSLTIPATTITSATPQTVSSKALGIGTYDIDVWMVTQNVTAADAGGWAFSFSGTAAATGNLVDFESKTTGTAVVGYGASSTFSTVFNSQGVAGNQQILMRLTLVVTAAGTLSLTGKQLVAGNNVTISAGGKFRIRPVVAT